jgi:hypothetical protein
MARVSLAVRMSEPRPRNGYNPAGRGGATHAMLILAVALYSFVLSQLPLLFSSKPYSIGGDGDSGIHVAIEMKLRDPTLFSNDRDFEMISTARPAFQYGIHRAVVWIADHLSSGDLFAANIATFWIYHLVFIAGCYFLALFVVGSTAGAALFAAASVGLSRALATWWGMVYAAVIPKDVGMVLVPWFVLCYLRWFHQPRKLAALFFTLGLAVNIYPFQPTFLAIIFLAVMTFPLPSCSALRGIAQRVAYALAAAPRRNAESPSVPRRQDAEVPGREATVRPLHAARLAVAFGIGALPAIIASAAATFGRLGTLPPADQAIAKALLVRYFSYLLVTSPLRTLKVIAISPVWWFLALAAVALLLRRWTPLPAEAPSHRLWGTGGSAPDPDGTDRRLCAFALWTAVLGLAGLVVGAIYRPLLTFFFHRASAFLYIPAYLACAWLVTYWLQHRALAGKAAAAALALLMLLTGAKNTALFQALRGQPATPCTARYYELADWAAEQSPPGSLFMVPPMESYWAFRVYSARSVLFHWITGEVVISHPQVGLLAWSMWNDIGPLYEEESSTADFMRVARKYNVDYIVTDPSTPQPPDLPVAFRNEVYTVFVVPPELP